MNKTKIEWCDATWNPVTGCLHGCPYCYARSVAHRFGLPFAPKLGDPGMEGASKYDSPEGMDTMLELEKPYIRDGRVQPFPMEFLPTFHRYRLKEPQRKKPQTIFVCSMADLFGEWVPDDWIKAVFDACSEAPQHNYLFLTKAPDRYNDLDAKGLLPQDKNFWYGASATTAFQMEKAADAFGQLSSRTRTFLSMEPLLEDIAESAGWTYAENGAYANWIIIGAMTGSGSKKSKPKRAWIEKIVKDCAFRNVPVFMKGSLAEIWGEELIQQFPWDRLD
ncbi:DUF5131 family protein [uncultured Dysosmobacter sp.]|uniref:DUF5131 family protein n=1 Tax=uncultured Dysosmobacter sp. TaxID=2591384 RepID=UPI00261D02DD|nr:DUF5131 family protein [uncultured Dysosmobacter sp.]